MQDVNMLIIHLQKHIPYLQIHMFTIAYYWIFKKKKTNNKPQIPKSSSVLTTISAAITDLVTFLICFLRI